MTEAGEEVGAAVVAHNDGSGRRRRRRASEVAWRRVLTGEVACGRSRGGRVAAWRWQPAQGGTSGARSSGARIGPGGPVARGRGEGHVAASYWRGRGGGFRPEMTGRVRWRRGAGLGFHLRKMRRGKANI